MSTNNTVYYGENTVKISSEPRTCSNHPRYLGIHKPRTDCSECLFIYKQNNPHRSKNIRPKKSFFQKPFAVEFKFLKDHPVTEGVGFGPFRVNFKTWQEALLHIKWLKTQEGVDVKSIVTINKIFYATLR